MAKSIIHFSGLLPKLGEEWVGYTQFVNWRLKKICRQVDVDLIYNEEFISDGQIDWSLIAKDLLHLSKKGVAKLGSNIKWRMRKCLPRPAPNTSNEDGMQEEEETPININESISSVDLGGDSVAT